MGRTRGGGATDRRRKVADDEDEDEASPGKNKGISSVHARSARAIRS